MLRTDPIRLNEKVFGSEIGKKINDAEKRYKDIVDESEKIIFETNNKAEKILSEAKKDGQDQGYIDGKKIADEESAQYKAQLDLEFQKNLELMQKEKQDFLIHTKNQLGEIFKTAFIKVFENEIAHSNTLLQILIMKGLRELSDEKEIRVILSENDYKIFDKEAFKVALGDLYSDKIITFAQDKNAQNGTCILETSLGYIDASLNHLARYVTMLIDDSIVESNEEGDDDGADTDHARSLTSHEDELYHLTNSCIIEIFKFIIKIDLIQSLYAVQITGT